MDPGLIFILAIIGFRIFRAVQSQNKKRSPEKGMKDLSKRSAKRVPVNTKHKRDKEDPFDGMHGDVLNSNLTIDDIVT